MKDSKLSTADRRFLRRALLDLIILIVLVLPYIICELVIEPVHSGFFCDDETIRYPFHLSTVSTATLVIIVLVGMPMVLLLVELTLFYRCGHLRETVLLLGYKVPTWLVEFVKHTSYLIFGALAALDATEIGKFTLGRLRPHFIAVCQPQLTDGSNCESPQNRHRYIENYVCVGNGYTLGDVREARVSFPSGHACVGFFAFTYLAIYMQHKFTWRGSQLLRHLLQFVLIMAAWYVALTRIMDNWHHWSDVLFGGVMGVAVAVVMARYVTKEFKTPQLRLRADLPRQDTCTTLNEIVPPLPPYTIGHGVGGSVPSLLQESNASSTRSFSNEQYCAKV